MIATASRRTLPVAG